MSHSAQKPVIEVAIALVSRNGRWLVARRHSDAHLGDLWEFPGGKHEDGEASERAALRELFEECGIEATAGRVLDPVTFDYGDRVVRLTAVVCHWRRGEPQPLGSAECRWVSIDEMQQLEMPAANAAVIRAALDGN